MIVDAWCTQNFAQIQKHHSFEWQLCHSSGWHAGCERVSYWIWAKSCKRYIHRKTKTGRAVLLEAEAALSIAQVKECFINHKCDYEFWRHVGKENLQQNEPANQPYYRRFWGGKDLLGWSRTIPKSGIPNEIQPGNAGADVIPQASCSTTPSLIDMSRLDDHIQ